MLKQRAETILTARHDYTEADLILITVPLNEPGLTGSATSFERYDGEIEWQGIHYHYVKRKISNGHLELLCLPNKSRDLVQEARIDFFKMMNELEHSAQHKGKVPLFSFKTFVTEYSPENNLWSIRSLPTLPRQLHPIIHSFVVSAFSNVLKQPPRA